MSVFRLKITTKRPYAYITSTFQTAGGNRAIAERIKQFIERVATGSELAQDTSTPPQIVVTSQGGETQATGTLTFTSTVATNTFAINGVTFTCVASGATGNQFNVGGTDTLTAAAAAAAINASVTALIPGYVTATSALTVVTVTAVNYGITSNQATLVGSANIAASAARLTGGAADTGTLTLNF